MSFRKRNVGLSTPSVQRSPTGSALEGQRLPIGPPPPPANHVHASGVRPSPVDGRPTTSTGVETLDALLAGHSGLVLGNSLLIEENGTTDFAGILLRYYAAEGIVQGHQVHIIGAGEHWGRDLPGLVGPADGESLKDAPKPSDQKMKIAWRYERLGDFGSGIAGQRALQVLPDRSPSRTSAEAVNTPEAFCHSFDLTKRLVFPPDIKINYIPITSNRNPFHGIIRNLTQHLDSSTPRPLHRIVLPTLLSPAAYPGQAADPKFLLSFLHSLRGLLRRYPTRLTAMITFPLELYERSTGLVRWVELLSDGMLELAPFVQSEELATSGAATTQEDKPQGMFKVHRLPIFHEKGGGGSGASTMGEDLAFTVSRRKFMIKPFSLPPMEGDTEAQRGNSEGATPSKDQMEF